MQQLAEPHPGWLSHTVEASDGAVHAFASLGVAGHVQIAQACGDLDFRPQWQRVQPALEPPASTVRPVIIVRVDRLALAAIVFEVGSVDLASPPDLAVDDRVRGLSEATAHDGGAVPVLPHHAAQELQYRYPAIVPHGYGLDAVHPRDHLRRAEAAVVHPVRVHTEHPPRFVSVLLADSVSACKQQAIALAYLAVPCWKPLRAVPARIIASSDRRVQPIRPGRPSHVMAPVDYPPPVQRGVISSDHLERPPIKRLGVSPALLPRRQHLACRQPRGLLVLVHALILHSCAQCCEQWGQAAVDLRRRQVHEWGRSGWDPTGYRPSYCQFVRSTACLNA